MKLLEQDHIVSPFGEGMTQSFILPLEFYHGHSFVAKQPFSHPREKEDALGKSTTLNHFQPFLRECKLAWNFKVGIIFHNLS